MKTLLILVSCFAVLVRGALAQQILRQVNGPAANDLFGKACIAIGDQNNDGFDDVLVGSPGFNQQRGRVDCLSGAYLASGTGTQILWSVVPPGNPGDLFGFALVEVGDIDTDGASDYVVGEPGYDNATVQDAGAVRLLSGATHALVSLLNGPEASCQFGSSLARCDDVTSDGRSELLVGAPGPNSVNSYAMVLLGTTLMTTADALAHCFLALFGPASEQYGAAVASGFDLDANGIPDMAVGAPGHAPGGAVFFGTITSGGLLPLYSSQIAGERMGASIDAAHDYDGDGVIDIVVGAPNRPGANGTQVGRAVVLSGARLASFAAPYELYTLQPTVSGVTPSTLHFGACVRASADLNGDGVGEILVGAPDFSTTLPFGPGKGAVSIFSGATGVRIASLVGANNDHVGDALAGAVEDLDGDGFREFVVAGSASDAGGTDSGVIKCYRLFPTAPSTYCTGKINSLGCTPSITFSGSPSASSAAPFLITATNFVNQKSGLLFYSHTPTAASFQGGTKCAMDPTVRTPVQSSGGSPSGADCTGAYSFDFNDWIATGWDASLAAGNEVYAQYWSRDPGSASHTSLSNALRLLVSP